MSFSRRKFLGGAGLLAAGAALSPLIKVKRAFGGGEFATKHVVILGIGGGLRKHESLGMQWGATMPNLFGNVPVISGFGSGDAGAPVIAPEYTSLVQPLVLPTPRATPLYTEGTLITNMRYAEGAPGHLQGQACLVSGYYNNIENRADARLPVPTIFELHRRETNRPATDAWYVSVVGGFYRALQSSGHPQFGGRYGGTFLSPPGVMSALFPLATSGVRELDLSTQLPTIPFDPDEDAAVARMRSLLDGNSPEYRYDREVFRASAAENAAMQEHVGSYYSDPTYQAYYPDSMGIGVSNGDGGLNGTNDALSVYHAEQILQIFKPSVMGLTLIDVDQCHNDFNAYLRGQQIADACVAHLWNFIQSTDGLRDETTLVVMPEHGRHLYYNGQNPDSLQRSGIDHGQGDDGDRDVWALILGPDTKQNQIIEPTGIVQNGRTSGTYETIDAVYSAMALLGHGQVMADTLTAAEARPGVMIQEALA